MYSREAARVTFYEADSKKKCLHMENGYALPCCFVLKRSFIRQWLREAAGYFTLLHQACRAECTDGLSLAYVTKDFAAFVGHGLSQPDFIVLTWQNSDTISRGS